MANKTIGQLTTNATPALTDWLEHETAAGASGKYAASALATLYQSAFGAAGSLPLAGYGTVTSVALTTPGWFTVGGSPITSAGTLQIVATSGQTAAQVIASPGNVTGTFAPRTLGVQHLAAAGATSSALGAVQLAGDLGGTANTPLVAALQGITLSATPPTTGQVLTASSAGAAGWAASGGGLSNPLAAGSLGTASLQLVAAGDGLWQPAAHIVGVQANSLEVLRAEAAAAAVNYLRVIAPATGTGVQLAAGGSDTDVSLLLVPKGAGVVRFPNGLAATPGIWFTDDGSTKTGLYCDGAHNVLFASGGANRLKFDGNSGLLSLGSGGQVRWTSGDPTAGADSNIFRLAASQLLASDTSGNPISIGQKYRRLTKTANYAAVLFDSFSVVDNAGASGEVDVTLPAAAAGLTYLADVRAAQTLKLIANGTDTIRLGASVSAAGGNIAASAVGCYALLTGFAGGWDGLYAGTWTVT